MCFIGLRGKKESIFKLGNKQLFIKQIGLHKGCPLSKGSAS